MVKHVILWNLKDEYSEEEKKNMKANIKREIEALQKRNSRMVVAERAV